MHEKLRCPLLNKDCIQEKCAWWVKTLVKNIQTGAMQESNNCVVMKQFEVALEGIHYAKGTQAAVEDSRNETVQRQDALLGMITRRAIATQE